MERMFGMMPRNEITIEKNYKDTWGARITIQAGPNGWTVIWADGSTWYEDETRDAEENFKIAYQKVKDEMGELTEADGSKSVAVDKA